MTLRKPERILLEPPAAACETLVKKREADSGGARCGITTSEHAILAPICVNLIIAMVYPAFGEVFDPML